VSYAIPQDEPGGAASAALAFVVHAMLFSLLFFGLRWQSKNPDPVTVELWNQLPPIEQPKVEPVPEAKPEPEPKPVLKLEPKLEPKVEPKSQRPDIAVEREKKTAKKPKKEKPLKFDATKRIQEQLAQEQQALRQSRERQEALKQFAQPAPRPSPDAGYVDKIRSKIRSNIVVPPDIKGNPEAIFNVEQLPTGEIKPESVRLTKSSGVKAFDDAVERAILKSSPLPRPDRPEQFRRDLQLKFRPRD